MAPPCLKAYLADMLSGCAGIAMHPLAQQVTSLSGSESPCCTVAQKSTGCLSFESPLQALCMH